MARALKADEADRVRRLWECALTCTIRVRMESSPGEVTVLSVHVAETFQAFEAMTDTFWVWSEKVAEVGR